MNAALQQTGDMGVPIIKLDCCNSPYCICEQLVVAALIEFAEAARAEPPPQPEPADIYQADPSDWTPTESEYTLESLFLDTD